MSATPVAIQDAELLLDLTEAGLLGLVFQLSFPFSTTELLWRELGTTCQRAIQPHVTRNRLLVVACSCEEQMQAASMAGQHQGLSLAECSVCCLAQINGWSMLASCASLLQRNYAPPCEVLGMNWLFQQLQSQAQLTKRDALAAAKRLAAVNPRLRVEQLVLQSTAATSY
jgi:hypothetical protein